MSDPYSTKGITDPAIRDAVIQIRREKARERYAKNREAYRKTINAWCARNRDKTAAYRRMARESRAGLQNVDGT